MNAGIGLGVVMAAVVAAGGVAGCGSSKNAVANLGDAGAGDGGLQGSRATGIDPPLAQPAVAFEGGAATSSGGEGRAGGTAHLVSRGGLTIGPDATAVPAPATQPPPPDATVVAAGGLDADLTAAGSVSIPGVVASRGSDGLRKITAGGDIFIDGTLRTADLGSSRQGLTLDAPAGTVYVTGTIDTSGAAGVGQAGGPLTIMARRLVVTGSLVSAGGDGATAGAAGAIVVTVAEGAFISNIVDASGGEANAAGATAGGSGANLTIQAGGDVVLGGVVQVRGGGAATTGAAVAQGGDAGTVAIECGGTVALTGTLDGRGGIAMVSNGAASARGGAAGVLNVGDSAAPQAIGIAVPLLLAGGDGVAIGGAGGTAQLEPHGGDLRISGSVDVSGGRSAAKPGPGGNVNGSPGPETTTAGVDVIGQVVSNGGAVTSGGSGDGAPGGVIKLVLRAQDGNLTVESTGQVQTDGGGSGATGTAGAGGLMYLFTLDGNVSIHGKLLARGGTAPDAGGTGGGGGLVYVFTGAGHDRLSGVLTIEADGAIDASGGTGTTGGSARNNGQGGVALFPVRQDDEYDIEQIAVLINSDGVHGADRGWIDNQGLITARGAAPNGAGGDVVFHGKRQDGNETPLSGNVDLAGGGTGAPGNFAGE